MSMKVTIEYIGFIKIDGVPSNSVIELPGGITVDQLLDRFGMSQQDRTYLIPIINRQRKSRETVLADGDSLFLYYPVGGG